MKFLHYIFKIVWIQLSTLLLFSSFSIQLQAQTISQKPQLASVSSAKPNLMLLLDNSGSMKGRYVPDDFYASFSNVVSPQYQIAYSSPDGNKLWYNPNVRYRPRINADGTTQADATQASALAAMVRWDGVNNPTLPFYYDPCTHTNCTLSLGQGYGTPTGTYSNTLTFNLCTTRDAAGLCTAVNTYNIPPSAQSLTFMATAYVAKAAARTDCVANATRCTWAEERQNALNWLLYYSTRIAATQSSIGYAFAAPKYNNKLRLGYGQMNDVTLDSAGFITAGSQASQMIKRGVRPFTDNAAQPTGYQTDRTDFYTWLYGRVAYYGTPSRQLLTAAGDYYLDRSNSGPWGANPVVGNDSSAHLACRRNTAVMFSDGAYGDATSATVTYNIDGGSYSGLSSTTHVDPKTGITFTYSITPSRTATYISYPDTVSNTMSDIAMKYWITDLRSDLTDTLTPITGNPAYWQHMVFYSIGYGIRGSVTPAQIAQYNVSYTSGTTPTALNWGDPASSSVNIINDYIHSGYSGRGKSFSVASSNEVQAAFDEVLSRTIDQSGSDAGVAVADTNGSLATLSNEFKYKPSYTIIEGSGEILAYKLDALGNVATPQAPEWYASRNIPIFSSRTLATLSGTGTFSPVDLSTAFTSLPSDVQGALGSGADQSFLDYIRGKTTGVNSTTGANFRIRNSLFGTMINSPPAYIRGELNMGYEISTSVPGASSYTTYRLNKSNNSLGLLLAPTNDGMLHIINPRTGAEVMGYIPRSVMPKLQQFASEPYDHFYMLDGPITEQDIYDLPNTKWVNMAIGSGGRGGKFVYGLSIPTVTTVTGSLTTPPITKNNLLWEINSDMPNFGNLGHVTNAVQTGYLPSGKWAAFFGNGYNSASGKASLFVVDALTGAFIQEITTNVGSATNTNALTGVTLVRNEQRVVVAVLAGDLRGNMWKFDFLSTANAGGKLFFANNGPLFTTIGNQPITNAPAWRPSNGGILVVASTGQLIYETDPTVTSVQSAYGILDKTPLGSAEDTTKFVAPANMSNLVLQTSTVVASTSTGGDSYYQTSANQVDYATKSGWKLDYTFFSGQRGSDDVKNLPLSVLLATVVPPTVVTGSETCVVSSASKTVLYQVDAETGGSSTRSGQAIGFFSMQSNIADPPPNIKVGTGENRIVPAYDRIGPDTEPPPSAPCDGTNRVIQVLSSNDRSTAAGERCGGQYKRVWQQLLRPPLIR